jgi:hypothetical protein
MNVFEISSLLLLQKVSRNVFKKRSFLEECDFEFFATKKKKVQKILIHFLANCDRVCFSCKFFFDDDDDGDFADDEFKEQLVHRHLFVLCN